MVVLPGSMIILPLFIVVVHLVANIVFSYPCEENTFWKNNTRSQYHYKTIIVGAGIIGSGIGYGLAMDGQKTLILEKGLLGHKDGSSHGGSRMLRYTHSDPMWLPLVHDAYGEWSKLQAKHGQQIYKVNGLLTLDINASSNENRAKILDGFRQGIAYNLLRAGEISDQFPHLHGYGSQWSALYEPGGITLLADKCLKAIQAEFIKTGNGEIREAEEVIHWESQQLRPNARMIVVVTKKGRCFRQYIGENIVFAVGGWLPRLLPNLAIKSEPRLQGSIFWDINPAFGPYFDPDYRGQPISVMPYNSMYKEANKLDPSPPLHPSPTLHIFPGGHDQGLYAIPGVDYRDKIRFCSTQSAQIEGGQIVGNEKRKIAKWMVEIPKAHIAEHVHWVNSSAPAKGITCIVTMTKDMNWIVDRHPDAPNAYIAGGFSGTGFKYALTIGKLVLHLMNNTTPSVVVLRDGIQFDGMDSFSLKRHIQ